ncbi:tetratricopeptide repeat protein [Larkinella soli]|uniref:tetratricopeptide repeat protein n=1 Tax=Larkinella soli TaxID=1770527 RepID=UPI000FFC8998|nr:hypothetical protein [Larkinella soli]
MLFFWKNWNTAHRTVYWTGLVLFLAAVTGMIRAWSLGLRNVVRWDVLSELIDLPASIDTFTDGLFDFPVTGKAYVITEQFVASAMQTNLPAAKLVTMGVCLGLVFILSAVTRFPRVPYLIAMTVLIVLSATFRLEILQFPGWFGSAFGGRLPFLSVVLVFGIVSYYFHAFKPELSLPVRLLVHLTLALGFWLLFSRLAGQPLPALAFVGYAMPGLLLISVGFIFWISTEIIAALVYITSVARPGRTDSQARPLGLGNFLFISGLYLANLVLIWLSNTRTIDWNPIIVSPFILFLISLVLGIWGFGQQLRQNEGSPSFRDSGAILYLGLALITLLTLTYAFASANDPLVEALEDTIVYTHLGVGLMFVVYVIANFLPLYRQGLPVYRVLYKPLRFSLLQTRLLAVMAVGVLLSTQNFFPFDQAVAGYFNNLGDLHAATGENRVAEQYYRLALKSEFQNHKSNYALASLALTQGDKVTATYYFQRALLKQPSPQAYAGLTSVLLEDNLFFEAVKMLQQGIRAFPKSGELQNNLGYLYAKTSVADSAYYYLAASTGNTAREEVPQTNLLAFWVRNPRLLSLDSLSRATEAGDYEPFEANRTALAMLRNEPDSALTDYRPDWLGEPLTDEGLSVGRFAHLYNYAVRNRTSDTTLLSLLLRMEQNPANQDFTDDLTFARAAGQYYTGHKRTAFELTDQLGRDNERTGAFYNSVTGFWMMDQGLYRKAAEIFGRNTDTLSTYYQALALTKAGDPLLAQSLWEVAGHNDPALQTLVRVLYGEKEPATDLERAFSLCYDGSLPESRQVALFQGIRDDNLKTIAACTLARRNLSEKQTAAAKSWYERTPQEARLTPYAQSLLTVTYLRLRNAQGEFDRTIADARQAVIPRFQAEKDFIVAQAYQAGRQAAAARQHYARALGRAPFNAEVVVAAAEFERQSRQTEKAYNLVLNALPLNDTDPALLKAYTLLCLEMSLTDYAQDGLARLRVLTSPTDYQAFLVSYQAKRSLIEKQREAFQ